MISTKIRVGTRGRIVDIDGNRAAAHYAGARARVLQRLYFPDTFLVELLEDGPGWTKGQTGQLPIRYFIPDGGASKTKKPKTPAQREREIAAALAKHSKELDEAGAFYLTDTNERELKSPRFKSRGAAKRAALQLVRAGTYPTVEVWHAFQGGRYMQGVADDEGWSDV